MVCDTMDMLYVISIFHWSGGSKRQRRDFTQSKWRHRQARETTLLHWPAAWTSGLRTDVLGMDACKRILLAKKGQVQKSEFFNPA